MRGLKVPSVALVALVGALASLPDSAVAQAADTAAVDTAASAALARMSAYLRTLKAFQVVANVTTDEVLVDGQRIQLASRVDMVAQAPNKVFAEVSSDRKQRSLFYDGTTFSVWARRSNYYASVPAPATTAELINVLEEKYGFDLPLVDLFRWGKSTDDVRRLTSAMDLGPSQVEGVTCQHYAFRQEGLDWQIWIQQGDYPLPRKLVLTTLTDEARPQAAMVYTWNLAPSYNDATFVFNAPADAKRIVLAELNVASAGKKP
jgi:hypothetical protein